MFRCNHCHTEYGGIRGIKVDRCPRCRAQSNSSNRPPAPVKISITRSGSLLSAR